MRKSGYASIAHVGIAVRSLEESIPFYRDILGLAELPLDSGDGALVVGLSGGASFVELLEPRTPESPIAKFVTRRGPGIHHVCFAMDDLDQALARCRVAGIRLIDTVPRRGCEGKRVAFLHPSSTNGVLVEMTES